MEKSQSIKHLAAALVAFHGKIGKIRKDSENPFFKSKYASLSVILDNIDQPLIESGLCFSQFPEGDDELTTILMHSESGEYIQSTYKVHPVKSDPQALGSAITYGRRYSLGAILGLNIEEDDDANAASMPQKQNKQTPSANSSKTAEAPWLNPDTDKWAAAVKFLNDGGNISEIKKKYRISKENENKLIETTLQAA